MKKIFISIIVIGFLILGVYNIFSGLNTTDNLALDDDSKGVIENKIKNENNIETHEEITGFGPYYAFNIQETRIMEKPEKLINNNDLSLDNNSSTEESTEAEIDINNDTDNDIGNENEIVEDNSNNNIDNDNENNIVNDKLNNDKDIEKKVQPVVTTAQMKNEVDVDKENLRASEKKDVVLVAKKENNIRSPKPPERVSLLEKIKIHRVKKGDNLWEIARLYDIDIDTIIGANDITNMNRIQVGDIIKILPVKGIIYKVNPGESLWTISRQFDISIDRIVKANAIIDPDLVQPGTTLILPGAKPEFGYQDRLSRRFIRPTSARISSYYGMRWGRMHEGLDFAVNTGSPIRAARSGKVVYSGWVSGYGRTIVIEHQKGVRTLYAHNSRLLVYGGQWVERGQKIALSGNSGRSTGPHLHFEIQINGKPVNPLNYLK